MKIYACILIALVALTGCQTDKPVTEVKEGETRLTTYTGVGLNIEGRLNDDGSLDRAPFVGQFLPNQDMKIVGARASSTPNGMPRVQFFIESQRDKSTAVQYRFTWLDEEGFVIQPDQNPWQSLHLAGREVADIQSVARSEKGTSFRLIVRPLNFKK